MLEEQSSIEFELKTLDWELAEISLETPVHKHERWLFLKVEIDGHSW